VVPLVRLEFCDDAANRGAIAKIDDKCPRCAR
jgi:hypothetical protein